MFSTFGYDELIKRDKLNLDMFWLKDRALTTPTVCHRTGSAPKSSRAWKPLWSVSAALRCGSLERIAAYQEGRVSQISQRLSAFPVSDRAPRGLPV